MVYVYKKQIGNKPYYYLRASEKKGVKMITKDIAYLGSSAREAEKALRTLTQHREAIRKAYRKIHVFLESEHYLEKVRLLKLKQDATLADDVYTIEACKYHYTHAFKKQDNKTKQEILKQFVVEFCFNTASIEGNTISLEEARKLLHEGLTPLNKTMREINDLQNAERVFFSLVESEKEITHEFIQEVHAGLMQNIDARVGYRKQDIRVVRSAFDATPAPYVKTDMELLLHWLHEHEAKLHPFVLAIVFHHKFEKIHPFMDGNGRTGRMLFIYFLLRKGYPPFIIRNKNREQYLHALRTADVVTLPLFNEQKYTELIRFLVQELEGTYWNIFL